MLIFSSPCRNQHFAGCAAEITDQQKRRCWGEDSVTSISIMARVPRDSPLLGSLVNFDESSASARTTPNYPDGGVGGVTAFKWQINHRIIYLRALSGAERMPSVYAATVHAHHADVDDKSSLAFGLRAISSHQSFCSESRLYGTGRRDASNGRERFQGVIKGRDLMDLNIKRREHFTILILKV